MSISNRLFTRSHLGRITFSALIALSVNLPAMAQVVPITPDAPPVQGTLVSTDVGLPDGRRYDVYSFSAQPDQVFSIRASSLDVPLASTLFILGDPNGPQPVATAFNYAPDILQYVYYNFPEPLQYAFRIYSADPQQPTGPSDTASYEVQLFDVTPTPVQQPARAVPSKRLPFRP